jgi:adenosylhomocysteine nucleosidase
MAQISQIGTKEGNILVCFAVKEEAKALGQPRKSDDWRILITGMGRKNAEKGIREALASVRPKLVITSGFAGGLNPQLTLGTVVFDEDAGAGLAARLLKAKAVAGKFHCADRVAVTAAEKWELWQSTGADAVEMESAVIREICRENNIPSATVRVISDGAGEDLPLDFNALMTADSKIDFGKLAATILRNPGKIPQLMAFQRNTRMAAKELGLALRTLFGDGL